MRMKLILGLLLLAWPLSAQRGAAEGDCRDVVAEALAEGYEDERLEACADAVVPELADAIRAAAAETDTAKLILLHRLGVFIRDPAIYESGLALGGNADAQPAARVLGLWVALTQVEGGTWFDRAFQQPVSETCEEATFSQWDGRELLDNGRAEDAEGRLYALAGSLAGNDAESLMVRRFARCVMLMLPDPDPPSGKIPPWPDEPPR